MRRDGQVLASLTYVVLPMAFSSPTETNLEFPQVASVSLVGHPSDFPGHSQMGAPPLSNVFARGNTLA